MKTMRAIFLLIPSALSAACVSTELDVRTNHPAHPKARAARVLGSSALGPDFDVRGDAESDTGRPAHESHAGHDHGGQAPAAQGANAPANAPTKAVYTCPMHPEIRKDQPGKCPICGMKLVPAKDAK
jgi:hypothetical protein